MEPGARFRKFDSEAESFEAHSELIANARRYRPAMDIAQDAKITDAIVRSTAFAAQLQACGYSTNPKYAEDLTWLIRRYNLIQYDTPPPDSPAAKEKAA
jgi:flagellum-specific peptidoglycan hydrolase FlgJ